MSLALELIPGLSDWYQAQKKSLKVLISIGVAVVLGLILLGFNCAGWFVGKLPVIECSSAGAQDLLWTIIVIWGSSQLTYLGVREFSNK